MNAIGYYPGNRRPDPAWEADRVSLPEAADFATEVARMLDPLRYVRLRASIFVFRFGGPFVGTTSPVICAALGGIGPVGILPGGATGFLYVGPRPAGDANLESWVGARVDEALRDGNLAFLRGGLAMRAHHFWTDADTDPITILREAETPVSDPAGDRARRLRQVALS